MKKDDFDQYLEEKSKDKNFEKRLNKARLALNIALKIQELVEKHNFNLQNIAERLNIKQEQIDKLWEGEFGELSLEELVVLQKLAASLGSRWRVITPFYFSTNRVEMIVRLSPEEKNDWKTETPDFRPSDVNSKVSNIPGQTTNLRWAIA